VTGGYRDHHLRKNGLVDSRYSEGSKVDDRQQCPGECCSGKWVIAHSLTETSSS